MEQHEEELVLVSGIIQVEILEDGKNAVGISPQERGKKYKIQEIMLGADKMRKCLPWTEKFLKEGTECKAEVLENGKLRII